MLYSFAGDGDGSQPWAGLIFDQAGNLYGATEDTVFELTPNQDGSWTESVIGGGQCILGSLIFDQAGNLYGTDCGGGSNDFGTVFKLAPNADGTWTESIIDDFYGQNGRGPAGGLIFDQAGNLYGTTQTDGGFNGVGTVFQLTPNPDGSWSEKLIWIFKSKDGFEPDAGVIFDAAGNLYGTTVGGGLGTCSVFWASGCGLVFKLTQSPNGHWAESVPHKFCSLANCRDGATPLAGLILDQAGNLYGTTWEGGNPSYCGGAGCGVVFKLTPGPKGGGKETVLHSFVDHPGAHPYAGLIFDAAGNLYGTTAGDGKTTFGTVFEITP